VDVICLGEAIVDIITRPVEKITLTNEYHLTDQILFKTGGDAQNNAIDLSAMGNHVAYVGRVSRDEGGEMIMRSCIEKGVDMSHVTRTATPQTKMNILFDKDANRSFLYYPGVSAEFTLADFDLSLLEDTHILQFSSTFHLTAFDGEAGALSLMKAAHAKGVTVSMDITQDFSGRWGQILEPCYPWIDYFLPSEDQAYLLSGTRDTQMTAEYFLDRGVKNVVIKLGARGCYCANRREAFFCSCHDIPVVDTTGAGDAFVAGFLSALLRQKDLCSCVKVATTASAFVIREMGANAGIRDYDEMVAFLAANPLQITKVY